MLDAIEREEIEARSPRVAQRIVVQDGSLRKGKDERCDAPVVHYEGERIYFRPLEVEDAPLLQRWVNDPKNWQYLMTRPPINAGREREWIESQGKDPQHVVMGIVVRDDDRLVGTCGLHGIELINRSASFGICVGDRTARSRGYGGEAVRLMVRYGFESLNLNRIWLDVFANNWRAIRAYQRSGFVHEGCLRQAAYKNGEYLDVYRFAILREEYEPG